MSQSLRESLRSACNQAVIKDKRVEFIYALIDILVLQDEALEWCAHTICMGDVYDREQNKQNKINLLGNISEAKSAYSRTSEMLLKLGMEL